MEEFSDYQENGWVGVRQKYPDGKIIEEAGNGGINRERMWDADGKLVSVIETYPREPDAALSPRVRAWTYYPEGGIAQSTTTLQSGTKEVIGYSKGGEVESFKMFDASGKDITPKPASDLGAQACARPAPGRLKNFARKIFG